MNFYFDDFLFFFFPHMINQKENSRRMIDVN